jgi:DNA-binding transcriptional regulator YiaG
MPRAYTYHLLRPSDAATATAHRDAHAVTSSVADREWSAGPDNIRFWDIDKRCGRLSTVDKAAHAADYRRLCAVVRQLRQEAGLTQVQVAAALDEHQSFVSKYESGERRLDVIELIEVLRVLSVPMTEFLHRLDNAG